MEVDAGGSGGGGGGGGGDKRWERGWKPTDPGEDAKRQKLDKVKDFTNVRELKALVGPFQKQLSEVESQIDGEQEKKTQGFEVMKERDAKMFAEQPDFWSRAISLSTRLKDLFISADKQMILEIISFEVREDESSLSFQFAFHKNSYFENRTLVKSYPLIDTTAKVKGDKVLWKENMNPAIWLTRKSFFEWFSDETPLQHDTIAQELLKFYRHPLQDVPSDEEDRIGRGSEV